MHNFHKNLYDAMSILVDKKGKVSKIPKTIADYFALEEYIRVDDKGKAIITQKGLELLGKLEEFKQNDLTRNLGWWGLFITTILSLGALIISLLMRGGT